MVEDAARQVTSVLRDEYPEELLAVGWYDGEQGVRTEVIYVADTFEELADNALAVLDEALLESISREFHTGFHDEPLQCTTRVYESLIDIDLPAGDQAGIIIALDIDAGPELMNVIELAHTVTNVELGLGPDDTT